MTGYAGCGFELSKMLYQRNGTIYVAGRNEEKAVKAVEAIKKQFPESQGQIEFLRVDLADLSSIKPAVESFLSKSNTLHVLTNNAGVMVPPPGSKTKQVSKPSLKPYNHFRPLLNSIHRVTSFRWGQTVLDHTCLPNCFCQC